MPAWMTSELRELVCVPIASSVSMMTTSRPDRASARAAAKPTTPAPTTTASTLSMRHRSFEEECAQAGNGGQGCERARAAVERGAEAGADQRAAGEADCADQGRGAAGGLGKRGKRGSHGVGENERGAEQESHERQDDGKPVARACPGERGGGEAGCQHQPG